MDAIIDVLDDGVRSAVVVGGGYIGLEMAEALRHRGIEVTLVEAVDQVMTVLDRRWPVISRTIWWRTACA